MTNLYNIVNFSKGYLMSDRAKAYTEAGVNIEAGNALVERIKKAVSSTHNKSVLTEIGGFGGLFKPDLSNMEEPILVSGTDGVGTKLKLAIDFDKHDTVGIDLVAMSVNDILVQGAKPLFFLDYFACSKLDITKTQAVIEGIAEGCRQSSCALLGGETAEMPDMYKEGDYDLAGFAVGIVDSKNLVDGSSIKQGDTILALPSSGVHSNGYSLVRKILDKSGLNKEDKFPNTNKSVADVLLEPTVLYTSQVMDIMEENPQEIKGMVHITGGGFYDNIPRVLPKNVQASIQFGTWDILPVFDWIQKSGNLKWEEMLQIFNCGIGYIFIVDSSKADAIMQSFAKKGNKIFNIGTIEARQSLEAEQVSVKF